MQEALVVVVALVAAGITFFSGFGLGTVLLPVFALFFPAHVAVAATAIVHLLNNGLKVGLLRAHIDRRVVLRFGVPAVIAAPVGALALDRLADVRALATYTLGGRAFEVHTLNLVLASLLIAAGLQELVPRLGRVSFGPGIMPIGGVASGFVGGLAGLQGALRSAFLIRAGLGRDGFIATGVAVGLMVDVGRVSVYGANGTLAEPGSGYGLILAAVAGAAAGTLIAHRALKKVTVGWIRTIVGVLLVAVALALGVGLV